METMTNYILDKECIGIMKADQRYKNLANHKVEKNGFALFYFKENGETTQVKFYNAELAYIICENPIKAFNRDTQQIEDFETNGIKEIFIKAFKEGVNEFNRLFGYSEGIADKETAKRIFETLKDYLERNRLLKDSSITRLCPLVLNDSSIKEYGFANAIYYKLHNFLLTYRFIINEFEKELKQKNILN